MIDTPGSRYHFKPFAKKYRHIIKHIVRCTQEQLRYVKVIHLLFNRAEDNDKRIAEQQAYYDAQIDKLQRALTTKDDHIGRLQSELQEKQDLNETAVRALKEITNEQESQIACLIKSRQKEAQKVVDMGSMVSLSS